jgi:hypothetical protein
MSDMPIDHADQEHLRSVGLGAVAAVARRLGLPADDLRVVSDRGNLLVHLAPAPVVARAATRTGWTRRHPAAWLAREVAVCAYAAARGGPVASPSPLADPGPHRVGPVALTLWEYRPPRPGHAAGPELGVMLAALHEASAGFPGALPWLAPARDQVIDTLHILARHQLLPASTLTALQQRHVSVLHELEQAGSAPVVLHGDAHAGNLLRDDRGWFWVDLEETCLGPPEWDLVVVDDPGAVAAYAARTGRAEPSVAELAPFRRARDLEAAVWLAAMAHLHPARYRTPADQQLAQVLGQESA